MMIFAYVFAFAVLVLNVHYKFDLGLNQWVDNPALAQDVSPYTTFALSFAQGSFMLPVVGFGFIFTALFITLKISKYGSKYLDDEFTADVDEGEVNQKRCRRLVKATLILSFLFLFASVDAGIFYMRELGIDPNESWVIQWYYAIESNVNVRSAVVTQNDVDQHGIFLTILFGLFGLIWTLIKGLTSIAGAIIWISLIYGLYLLYDWVLCLIYLPIVVMCLFGFAPGVFAAYIAAKTHHPAKGLVLQTANSTRPDKAIEKRLAAVIRARVAGEDEIMALVDQLSPLRRHVWRIEARKYLEDAKTMEGVLRAQTNKNQADVGLATELHALERSRRAAADR